MFRVCFQCSPYPCPLGREDLEQFGAINADVSPLANNFAENNGLFKEEHLEFFNLFRRQFAQLCAAVELTVQEQFALSSNFPLKIERNNGPESD